MYGIKSLSGEASLLNQIRSREAISDADAPPEGYTMRIFDRFNEVKVKERVAILIPNSTCGEHFWGWCAIWAAMKQERLASAYRPFLLPDFCLIFGWCWLCRWLVALVVIYRLFTMKFILSSSARLF
jgi:hypothetical protein